MVVIEAMDYVMLDIIDKGLHIPTFVETKVGASIRVTKRTQKHQYNEEYKIVLNLDFCASVAIGKSFPYYIYHVVQKYTLAEERIDTLTVADEGTDEVKSTRENNLNRKY